jgi:hypothetical protein
MYVNSWHIKRKRWFKIHGINNFKILFSKFSFLCVMGIEFKSHKILIFHILLLRVQLLKISGRIPHFIWHMSRRWGYVSGEHTCILYNPWLPWERQKPIPSTACGNGRSDKFIRCLELSEIRGCEMLFSRLFAI